MILCASQPCYLAWPPLLDRIAAADVFVVMDAVQFEKGSYVNRNKIPLNGKDHWLTIPVHASITTTIADTSIDWSKPWQRKHTNSVSHAYGITDSRQEWLRHVAQLADCRHLGPLVVRDLEFWLNQYSIRTPVKLMPLKKRKPGGNELLLDLMADFKADTFLAGPLFKNYVNEELWKSSPYQWKEHKSRFPAETFPYPALHYWMLGTDLQFSSSRHILTTKQSAVEEPSSVPSHRDFRSTSSL